MDSKTEESFVPRKSQRKIEQFEKEKLAQANKGRDSESSDSYYS